VKVATHLFLAPSHHAAESRLAATRIDLLTDVGAEPALGATTGRATTTPKRREFAEDQRTTTASANPTKSASPVTSVAPKRLAVA
jgi:hypothetical protein